MNLIWLSHQSDISGSSTLLTAGPAPFPIFAFSLFSFVAETRQGSRMRDGALFRYSFGVCVCFCCECAQERLAGYSDSEPSCPLFTDPWNRQPSTVHIALALACSAPLLLFYSHSPGRWPLRCYSCFRLEDRRDSRWRLFLTSTAPHHSRRHISTNLHLPDARTPMAAASGLDAAGGGAAWVPSARGGRHASRVLAILLNAYVSLASICFPFISLAVFFRAPHIKAFYLFVLSHFA